MIYYNKDVKLTQASCEGETRAPLAIIFEFRFTGQSPKEMAHNKYTERCFLLL
jgi:hypothetical protein